MSLQSSGNGRLYPLDYRSQRAVDEHFLNDYPMRAFHSGQQLYGAGRHWNAIMAFQYGLRHDPTEFRLHMMLIVAYLSLGKKEESERQMEILLRLHPSEATRVAIQEVLKTWRYIPDTVGDLPRGEDNHPPHFTLSLLGVDGQFGNQIFQYALAKLYTEKYGMRLETYPWVGNKLFGAQDPGVSIILPFITEIEYLREDVLSVPPGELGVSNRDCQGYFQYHTRHYAAQRNAFRSFFKPVSVVEWLMQAFLKEIRKRGSTLVAIHLRLGDAASQGRSAAIHVYVEWLKELWPTLDNPVLFIASDDLDAVRRDLEIFRPITSEGVVFPLANMGYYPDFYMLTQADYLAAGNSTFSFAASMLNERARLFVRPNAANTRLEPYDPWNAAPIL